MDDSKHFINNTIDEKSNISTSSNSNVSFSGIFPKSGGGSDKDNTSCKDITNTKKIWGEHLNKKSTPAQGVSNSHKYVGKLDFSLDKSNSTRSSMKKKSRLENKSHSFFGSLGDDTSLLLADLSQSSFLDDNTQNNNIVTPPQQQHNGGSSSSTNVKNLELHDTDSTIPDVMRRIDMTAADNCDDGDDDSASIDVFPQAVSAHVVTKTATNVSKSVKSQGMSPSFCFLSVVLILTIFILIR